jgi:hypothetical protein
MTQGFARVRAFFGAMIALVIYLIVGGTVIFLIFRGCEGDHRYMHVGRVGGPLPPAAAS